MIKYVQAPARTPEQKRLYAHIQRDFGLLAEPFTLHAPALPLVAGIWMGIREALLCGHVRRDVKEAVAAAVSTLNRCPYCVDAHTIMLYATHQNNAARMIDAGQSETITDPAIRAAVLWAGATRSPGDARLRSPGFPPEDAPEMIGTAVLFHYINRMVTILLAETPLFTRRWMRGMQQYMAGLYLTRAVNRAKVPGESLDFLPSADLPADLAWTQANPTIAAAFARWAAAVESAGKMALSQPVRDCLMTHLAQWDGRDPGLGDAWLKPMLADLPDDLAAEGRLTLLAAFTPYRVTAAEIAAYRQTHPTDSDLIGALAWASLTTARHIGGWLVVG
ncbi:MAG: carboxymuconolactone decarboxylase family protein [Anaerolineae bacterium]|nr:carboxymuconolactone decarboxylase family protein [Anaerolineae bacterium]